MFCIKKFLFIYINQLLFINSPLTTRKANWQYRIHRWLTCNFCNSTHCLNRFAWKCIVFCLDESLTLNLINYPFTAPAVRPLAINLCNSINKIATGTVAITAAAENWVQWAENELSINCCNPVAKVWLLASFIKELVNTNSL